MSKNICTIIAKNYISFARTLCSSFLEFHPDGKCYVLIIDAFDGFIDEYQEIFQIIKTDDLNISDIQSFCYKYNITELATAFKPYLLNHLFDSNEIDNLLYLDPDILVTHSLDDLYSALKNGDILLTPHLDKDFPDDGLLPDDSHIMRSGIYNLGFIGLRKCENVKEFLLWWKEKLYDKCVIDHELGYFVDQKFIDFATVLFPNIKVIYDTGYNVAYWNIHSRKVHKHHNVWMCNDGILYFYHFSNFKPENPTVISGHQNRFNLKDHTGLADLFMFYINLLNQNGYRNSKRWPYSFKYYTNGKIIGESDRFVYRKMMNNFPELNPFIYDNMSFKMKINILADKIKKILLKIVTKLFGNTLK